MKRRDFIMLLGGAAAMFPLAGRAQQPAVIGLLGSRFPIESAHLVAAFREGLRARIIEGQNLAIEQRWAEGIYEHLPALAAALVDRQVAAIFATGGARTGR